MNIRLIAAQTLLLSLGISESHAQEPESRPKPDAVREHRVTSDATPTVRVGANIRVSQGTLPFVEPVVTVNPGDPRHLLGAAMAIRQPDGRAVVTAFTSFDGGTRWQASVPPEQEASEGADPQVAFTPTGAALLTAVTSGEDDVGNYAPALHVYRSRDGGRRFDPAVVMAGNYDHEKLAVDPTSGTIHIAAMVISRLDEQRGLYQLVLFSSDDDGRSFSAARPIVDGGGDTGLNVIDLTIANDGRLVVFYTTFAYLPEEQASRDTNTLAVVWSEDQGASWSPPVRVGSQRYRPAGQSAADDLRYDDPLRIIGPSEPTFAFAAGTDEQRLLAAWTSFVDDDRRQRIVLSRSADGGVSWTAPRAADRTLDADAMMPTLASGPRGRVALSWLASGDGAHYDVWLAIADGPADPFSRPIRVSSASSIPARGANLLPFASAIRSPRGTFVFTQSTFARYPYGGDYAGLAIDSDGHVHAFWPDSRDDGFQIHTSRIPLAAAAPRPAHESTRRTVDDLVDLLFEPVQIDTSTGRLVLPVRLRNRGTTRLIAPVHLTVTRLVDQGTPAGLTEGDGRPRLLGVLEGNGSDGSVLDISAALGDSGQLEGGAVSEVVEIAVRVTSPAPTIMLEVEIEAGVESPPDPLE